ncbi:hypothetical protein NODU109028_17445 [Nocardioides dubius]|uniref:hypothetical protein n=1 Tax=Nocardioides dubius TaxID=317019 RepID=UPI0031E44CEE
MKYESRLMNGLPQEVIDRFQASQQQTVDNSPKDEPLTDAGEAEKDLEGSAEKPSPEAPPRI